MSVRLTVRNLKHVPAFKNTKMIARGRLITDPKKQKWMKACEDDFVSQLRSMFPTIGTGTVTALQALYSIAFLIPLDDSLEWIGELSVRWQRVSKGEEGATIEIESLNKL